MAAHEQQAKSVIVDDTQRKIIARCQRDHVCRLLLPIVARRLAAKPVQRLAFRSGAEPRRGVGWRTVLAPVAHGRLVRVCDRVVSKLNVAEAPDQRTDDRCVLVAVDAGQLVDGVARSAGRRHVPIAPGEVVAGRIGTRRIDH